MSNINNKDSVGLQVVGFVKNGEITMWMNRCLMDEEVQSIHEHFSDESDEEPLSAAVLNAFTRHISKCDKCIRKLELDPILVQTAFGLIFSSDNKLSTFDLKGHCLRNDLNLADPEKIFLNKI